MKDSQNASTCHLHLGQLFSPDEFRGACQPLNPGPNIAEDEWAVGMTLPGPLVEQLHTGADGGVISLIVAHSDAGICYPVLVVQTGSLQIRIVMSLSEGRTAHWMRANSARRQFTLVAEVEGGGRVFFLYGACPSPGPSEVEEYIRSTSRCDREARISDGATMLDWLTRPEALDDRLPCPGLHELHVVLVDTGPYVKRRDRRPAASALH